ncbi:protein boule-like isoform X3 [Liolophura sinensis]|uniref:protein boule-like isoform X3 n=1 Tax=Liolophura sinensis TaxID=3198878 RepID=UPI0031596926
MMSKRKWTEMNNEDIKSSSGDVSPSPTPSTTPLSGTHAPKYGTVVPNRIFVGGIAANTTEAELKAFFSTYGAVKDTKIIADRAGVSKGYGFVTFETQDDAEKIIKKEADNLVFKDRKLNIGPAVRKQAFPRTYGLTEEYMLESTAFSNPNLSQGTILFTNGVPYTYQNGMAVFPASEGSYPVPQPQQQTPYSTMVMPQPQAVYVAAAQQYQAYQHAATTPQWPSPSGQWRWAPQVGDYKVLPYSPSPTVTGSPSYVYPALHTTTELMYAQPPPQAYQPELTEAGMLEGAPVEGSLYTVDHALGNRYYPTGDVHQTTLDQSGQRAMTALYPLHAQPGKPTIQYKKPAMTVIPSHSLSADSFMMTPPNKVQIISKPSHLIQRSPSTMSKPSDCGDGSGPLTPPPTPIGK